MSQPAFIKIKLTFLDEYDFGQNSKAKFKSYLQIPTLFFDDHRLRMVGPTLSYSIIQILLKYVSTTIEVRSKYEPGTIVVCKSDLSLPNRINFECALNTLCEAKLVEIVDDALTVKTRQTKTIQTNPRQLDTEKQVTIVTPKKATPDSPHGEIGKQASELIGRYCELWKAKYKTNVSVSGKWAGNAKTLVKDHGLKRSVELVEAFMEINDTWFIQNRHSFDLILTKLAQINHFAGTGVQITQTQLRQADQAQANRSAAEIAISIIKNRATQ